MVAEVPYDRLAATAQTAAIYLTLIEAQDGDPYAGDPRLSLKNLAWICRTIQEKGADLPIDKPSRWLGFVQGCLAMRGLIDVDEERSATRPRFHRAYREEGIAVPSSYQARDQE